MCYTCSFFSNLHRRYGCRKLWKGQWTDLFTIRPAWSKNTQKIAAELNIHSPSELQNNLRLTALHVPAQVISDTIKHKRLEHLGGLKKFFDICQRQLQDTCFSLKKNFYLNPPVHNQENRVWAVGKKREVDERAKLLCATRPDFSWRLLQRQRTIAFHAREG